MSFEYKTFPYEFTPRGASVAEVIKDFNHQNMNQKVVEMLVAEFNQINIDKLPPKVGREVLIPVLLPFCEKHEKSNKRNKEGRLP